jgi:uncharacterized protein YegL
MRNDFTFIAVLLDKSGSMSHLTNDTIGGYNAFLKGQKEAPGDAVITLVQFDDKFETTYANVPVKEAAELNSTTYVTRGGTALNDAVARLVDETGEKLAAMPEDERPAKVLIVILTDGEENQSRIYAGEIGRQQVMAKVQHQREVYNWEFMFLGANMDAIKVAETYGVAAKSAMSFSPTSAGTSELYKSMSKYATKMRSAFTADEVRNCAFDADDRKAQDDLLNKP